MLQSIVVALIVCAAACYAIWTLVPPVRRLFGKTTPAGACGGCNGCGTSKPADAPIAASGQPVRIVRGAVSSRPDRS